MACRTDAMRTVIAARRTMCRLLIDHAESDGRCSAARSVCRGRLLAVGRAPSAFARLFGSYKILLREKSFPDTQAQGIHEAVAPQQLMAAETRFYGAYFKSGGSDQIEHVLAAKESQVGPVENPGWSVAKIPKNDSCKRTPIENIGQADHKSTAVVKEPGQVLKRAPRIAKVLQHVAANDDIEALRLEVETLLFDVRDYEAVDLHAILLSPWDRHQLDADHFTSFTGLLQSDEHGSFGRADVKHASRT